MSVPERSADCAAAQEHGLTVPSAPKSVALVRQYASDACVALGWADSLDTIVLLVSELATNAVLHAGRPELIVRVLTSDSRLRVEVCDGSPDLPAPRDALVGAENGRGLELVEALASRWGVLPNPEGKTIWFEIGD